MLSLAGVNHLFPFTIRSGTVWCKWTCRLPVMPHTRTEQVARQCFKHFRPYPLGGDPTESTWKGKLAAERWVGDWSAYHVRANLFDLLPLVEGGQQSSRPSIDARNGISHTSLAVAAHDRVHMGTYRIHGESRKASRCSFTVKISYNSEKHLQNPNTQISLFFLYTHDMLVIYSNLLQ